MEGDRGDEEGGMVERTILVLPSLPSMSSSPYSCSKRRLEVRREKEAII